MSALSGEVQDAYEQYQQLSYLRKSLKQSFSLTLLLVLLFSFFSAVWAAIYSARRLLSPVVELGEATRAVAEGDYTTRLTSPGGGDELTFLVSSFNDMTQRIAQARDEAARSQQQVEQQRQYLQTLLEHLSTGVISIDSEGMQTMFRLAAALGVPVATNVVTFSVDRNNARVECELEAGVKQLLEMPLPCVIAAGKGLNKPKYPTFMDIRKAKKKEIKQIELDSLPIEKPTARMEILELKPAVEQRQPTELKGPPEEAVRQLIQVLREEAKVL